MGFEPTRAEHNGLAVHRLNHSATSSWNRRQNEQFDYRYIDAINMLLSQQLTDCAILTSKMNYLSHLPQPVSEVHASLVLEAKHEFYALICGATRDVAYACRWWNSTCIQWFATLAERSLIQLLGVQQQFGQRKQNTVECCKKSVSTCRQWKVGIKTTKERACRDQDSNLGCHGHNVKY